ncbi:4-alpha-glucanotransferase [Spironucleus salmonicida]|uniref:4-alpha-glucanotransferase n=1 Tax=Spironucleus salmonicida TaxID=348837 RepID=V6LJL3_9EUKA|nr:4-alpha-glucanotransferase [Spironucleus salmonicida]|eukprot:EST44712.1 4-alpha-glucanotransferase [Spironucleus salmonicida]
MRYTFTLASYNLQEGEVLRVVSKCSDFPVDGIDLIYKNEQLQGSVIISKPFPPQTTYSYVSNLNDTYSDLRLMQFQSVNVALYDDFEPSSRDPWNISPLKTIFPTIKPERSIIDSNISTSAFNCVLVFRVLAAYPVSRMSVCGSFTNWTDNLPMRYVGNRSFEAELQLPKNQFIQFKYFADDYEAGEHRNITASEPITVINSFFRFGDNRLKLGGLTVDMDVLALNYSNLKTVTDIAAQSRLSGVKLLQNTQCVSSFALNPIYLDTSLLTLSGDKVLPGEAHMRAWWAQNGNNILLQKARNWAKSAVITYWLPGYCLFMALSHEFGSTDPITWPETSFFNQCAFEVLSPLERETFILGFSGLGVLQDELDTQLYLQFVLHGQLLGAARYAAERRIFLQGDLELAGSAHPHDVWQFGALRYNFAGADSAGILHAGRIFSLKALYFGAFELLGIADVWEGDFYDNFRQLKRLTNNMLIVDYCDGALERLGILSRDKGWLSQSSFKSEALVAYLDLSSFLGCSRQLQLQKGCVDELGVELLKIAESTGRAQ